MFAPTPVDQRCDGASGSETFHNNDSVSILGGKRVREALQAADLRGWLHGNETQHTFCLRTPDDHEQVTAAETTSTVAQRDEFTP